MKLEIESNAFNKCLSQIESIIYLSRNFPENVFKELFSETAFINSDEIFVEGFIPKIKTFLKSISEDKFYFIVLEPNPKKYFFHHFNKYPLIEVSIVDEEDDYFSIIEENPGESPADAIRYVSKVILIYSDSLNWAIYINRDYEVGIIGAKKREITEKFVTALGRNLIFSGEEVIEKIFSIVFSNTKTGIPDELVTNFRKNYGDH
jgi:hypothetical protein